jgi:hypothetical protein
MLLGSQEKWRVRGGAFWTTGAKVALEGPSKTWESGNGSGTVARAKFQVRTKHSFIKRVARKMATLSTCVRLRKSSNSK